MGAGAVLGDLGERVTRRLVGLAVALVLARRFAAKLASALGHRIAPAPPPLDSARPPGWMPRRRGP